MSEGIRLLVGLGNPTARYEKTRHNAGFWFVDRAAQEWRVILRNETRFQGALGRCDAKPGSPLFFFKPMIYMNRSGQAVSAVANYYKLAPAEILVIHDDLDLPPGSVRLKKGGLRLPPGPRQLLSPSSSRSSMDYERNGWVGGRAL